MDTLTLQQHYDTWGAAHANQAPAQRRPRVASVQTLGEVSLGALSEVMDTQQPTTEPSEPEF